MSNKIVTIFGGSGFLGREIIDVLMTEGFQVRVITRDLENIKSVGNLGDHEKIDFMASDYSEAGIENNTRGSFAVINLVGILFEKGARTFQHAHTKIPYKIALASKKNNVENVIHVSALGIDRSASKYAASKVAGEKALFKEYPDAVVLRPSIIFGAEDSFFNMFNKMSRFMPAFPLIGGGKTKFQPVFVRDVAEAVGNILIGKLPAKQDVKGNTYHLGGPTVLSFKEIYQKLFEITGRKRFLVPLPWGVAKLQAGVMQLMPTPMLTTDQVESLKSDNVIVGEVLTLQDLNVKPTNMDAVLPTYLKN